MKTELMGFWKYSDSHFTGLNIVLGGEVAEIIRDGRYPGNGYIETKEFGKGHYFKPTAFLPVEEGQKLEKKIEDLRGEFAFKMKELAREYQRRVNEVLPFKI